MFKCNDADFFFYFLTSKFYFTYQNIVVHQEKLHMWRVRRVFPAMTAVRNVNSVSGIHFLCQSLINKP